MTTIEEDKFDWQGKSFEHKKNTYIAVQKLGVGAFASVWMVYSINLKKLFAIKIFFTNEKKSGLKELKIYSKFKELGTRHVLSVYDSFERQSLYSDDMHLCIVMDLMAGSMYDIIKKGHTDNKIYKSGFHINFVIKVTKYILETLQDLHLNGIIHGDIKPENILLNGQTKLRQSIIEKLVNKTSTKKIIETIKEEMKKIDTKVPTDSDIESDSTTDDANEDDEVNDDEISGDSNEENSDDGLSKDECIEITESDEESDNELINEAVNNKIIDKKKDIVEIKITEKDANKKLDMSMDIADIYFANPIVKLSDLGSCVDKEMKIKPKTVNTKYYRPPEILLKTTYDTSADIWALGCTTYELLTGTILFNPDHYDVDAKRCIVQLICTLIGEFPESCIDESPIRDVFFTQDRTIKTPIELDKKNVWMDLLTRMEGPTIQKYLLIDLVLAMLKTDRKMRITANDALDHPVFKFKYD